MIQFTRFNDSTFYVNPELIETVEETPDTVVTLTTGRKFIVRESAEQIMNMVIEYRQRVFSNGIVIRSFTEEN
ncbi:MAG: flagellar FlbD family protein [Lachnospiraceae bacterium]